MLVLTIQDLKEIEKNSPVFSEQGLVGRINNIGVLTAEVLLLQDIRSSVPIISGESSLHGILNGKGLDRKGELQFIKKKANFKTHSYWTDKQNYFALFLLKPHLFNLPVVIELTTFGFIFPLHSFLNFKKTELAAATLICCPIILLHNDKKIFFLVVKVLSLYLSISFFITLSFERYFIALDQYFGCLLTFQN